MRDNQIKEYKTYKQYMDQAWDNLRTKHLKRTKQVRVWAWNFGLEDELPVYHLPYAGEIYIGHNPPSPRSLGFYDVSEDLDDYVR